MPLVVCACSMCVHTPTGADPGILKGGVQRNFFKKGEGAQPLTRGNLKIGGGTPGSAPDSCRKLMGEARIQ
jgi:hypothetical protein